MYLQVSDPFGTMPVTSSRSGITYRNYYCAVCNSDSEDIKFWRPRLECPSLTGILGKIIFSLFSF